MKVKFDQWPQQAGSWRGRIQADHPAPRRENPELFTNRRIWVRYVPHQKAVDYSLEAVITEEEDAKVREPDGPPGSMESPPTY